MNMLRIVMPVLRIYSDSTFVEQLVLGAVFLRKKSHLILRSFWSYALHNKLIST